ncbi:thiol peroxidase [Muriicola marianensis]|uniref:Thiol peroxidase n=1 Tax=Muriicola marianensis TaxID=1324801 RepID=A0ABQ1QSJ5_9FLAO|nr:thiol peroxidase [Muriicola marianensis]GGD40088.1 putative thiol peroxidase [Muriicola marianensis]
MALIQFTGTSAHTSGELPAVGSIAPDFELTKRDLTQIALKDFKGKKMVLNVFPSLETDTCALSVRAFNSLAAKMENTTVLCISRDLPFAQSRFCGAEGINRVMMLSDYKDKGFAEAYGLLFTDGPFEGLLARAVIVLDENRRIVYTEMVKNIGVEPNYKSALEALQND